MAADTDKAPGPPSPDQTRRRRGRALGALRRRIQKPALRVIGYGAFGYLLVRLIPDLRRAWGTLTELRWEWAVVVIGLEVLSEVGFVVSWRGVIDPENMLSNDGHGRGLSVRVAWAQLGAATVLPGGSVAGLGVGAWILHRLGMKSQAITERQFNLSFLNTAVSGFALVIFGVGMAVGVLSPGHGLALTLLPALGAAAGLVGAARAARGRVTFEGRLQGKHPKLSQSVTTLGQAVGDTKRLLFHRTGARVVAGSMMYLGCNALVLWASFFAIRAHPQPGIAVIMMAYVIGALGGSIPLPGSLGAAGGIAAMLVLYGVGHNAALVAVLVYGAASLVVPLVGGGIAYVGLRRSFGPMRPTIGRPGNSPQ